MTNIFRFPGTPEPSPQPESQPDLFENFGRALIEMVGDMTVGEALEKLARMPAKDVLKNIFGANSDGSESSEP